MTLRLRTAVVFLYVLLPAVCSAGGKVDGLASQIAALAADPQTFQITPATAVEKLRPVVLLAADAATEGERTLSGAAPAAGVVWARVYFQEAAKAGQWKFLQLRLGLAPPQTDRPSFREALAVEVAKRLGKPKTSPGRAAERLQSWSLGKHRVVGLRDGTFENPLDKTRAPVVLVEIAIEQGEAD
jgi:hypothetical protein